MTIVVVVVMVAGLLTLHKSYIVRGKLPVGFLFLLMLVIIVSENSFYV